MTSVVTVEIAGFSDTPCGPFPCHRDRTCGLEECAPSENLFEAFKALKNALKSEFGDQVTLLLTPLDDGVPERIRQIVELRHPPLPIVLVNGKVVPIGRISLPQMRREIQRVLERES
ncbi:MAG: hypothetical protein QHG99_00970 [Methanomicrobiales archaeon]|nr:hypothetical protein [Methanomicrobiales archaeon]